jgi:membrane protein involved in colicin uptake
VLLDALKDMVNARCSATAGEAVGAGLDSCSISAQQSQPLKSQQCNARKGEIDEKQEVYYTIQLALTEMRYSL